MFTRTLYAVGLCTIASIGTATVVSPRSTERWPHALVAHEWGTFTSVADENGRAIDWLPLGGPSDLPCFVEHFDNRSTVKILPAEDGLPLDYARARNALLGRVRMETPVLYFYSDRERIVSAKVGFPQGRITEWYPAAISTKPALDWGRFKVLPADSTAALPREVVVSTASTRTS